MTDQLQSIVARIERLEEERAAIAADIKEVYAEAKANGYDVKILSKVIAMRKKDVAERQEEEAMTDVYMANLGMVPDQDIEVQRRDGVMATYSRAKLKPVIAGKLSRGEIGQSPTDETVDAVPALAETQVRIPVKSTEPNFTATDYLSAG